MAECLREGGCFVLGDVVVPDCPWPRPTWPSATDGLRQGNCNAEVAMVRYVTEESFHVFMWQTCERKAAFIHQVMAGDVAGREVDDVGDVPCPTPRSKRWPPATP